MKKQLVFLDIDGVSPDVIYSALDDQATALSRIGNKGIRVDRGVTVFPAVTLCCQASMYTGVFPGTHGIVGNRWFDRKFDPPVFRTYVEAKYAAGSYGFGLFGLPTIILPERPELNFANNDMRDDVRTVYQMAKDAGLESWQVFNQYSRGVDRWIKPSRPEMILFALCHEGYANNKHWDRANISHAIKVMKKEGRVPDIFVLYESGLDNQSHDFGPAIQHDYFRTIVDPQIARFFDELAKLRPLDEYHFVITSDHRQAAITKDMDHVVTIEKLVDIFKTVPGGGFSLFDLKGELVHDDNNAVLCYEAGTAQIHLKNRAKNSWHTPPDFDSDIIPVAQTFQKLKNTTAPYYDIILVRRQPGADYEVFDNDSLIPLETFFADKDDRYPDAVRRIRGINCSRSGDVTVMIDFSSGYYFHKKPKAGEHGSLAALDSLIPIIVSGPGVPNLRIPTASLVDVVPTVGRILDFDTTGAQGKSLF